MLLFGLNWLDAQLTLIWVRAGLATEGNWLMAQLLDSSELLFLAVKILVGLLAATIFYKWAHLKVAQRGVTIALTVYGGVMLIHLVTGTTALGWTDPEHLLAVVLNMPVTLLSFMS